MRVPDADGTKDLGSAARRFRDLFLSRRITLSDAAGDPTAAGQVQRNGATLKFHDGTAVRTINIREAVADARLFGAVADGEKVTDGAMTAASATLTSASNPFVAADVGKTVSVGGAGTAGAPLVSTISTFVNSGNVTLANVAVGTVTGATVMWGTDNGVGIQAAVNALTRGTVIVPSSADGKAYYVRTGIQLKSNVHIVGYGALIYSDASIVSVGSILFNIEDKDNTSVRGFRIEALATGTFAGNRNPQVAVRYAGVVRNSVLEDLDLVDHQNFAIEYADADTNPVTAFFDGIYLQNIKISGDTGPVGDGSGVIFFNQAQNGVNPASRGLYIRTLYCDVTRGNTDQATHGPQALKIQNVDGVFLAGLDLRGGDVAALDLNGVRNLHGQGIHTSKADKGVVIKARDNVVTTVGRRILLSGFTYTQDGVTNGNNWGIVLQSGDGGAVLEGVEITNFDIEGDIRLEASSETGTIRQIKIAHGRIVGLWTLTAPGVALTAMTDLDASDLTFVGGAGTGDGRISLSNANWLINSSQFRGITFIDSDGNTFILQGNDNTIRDLISINSNPDNDVGRMLVSDLGARNSYDGLKILGGRSQSFISKTDDNTFELSNLSGTPKDSAGVETQGLALTNKTIAPVGEVEVVSGSLDLSGAATGVPASILFQASQNYYILSIQFLYSEASSADAGVAVNIGNLASATSYLAYTSEVSKALGDVTRYINTSGGNFFATRRLDAGDFLRVGTAGGKTGTGEVVVLVTLVKSID